MPARGIHLSTRLDPGVSGGRRPWAESRGRRPGVERLRAPELEERVCGLCVVEPCRCQWLPDPPPGAQGRAPPWRRSPAAVTGRSLGRALPNPRSHTRDFLSFLFFSLFWLGGVALVATALRSRSRGAKGIGGRGWGEARGTPRSRASPGEVRPQDK